MKAEFDCVRFSGHRLEITEEEVVIAGLKIPISSILDVALFPISGNMRGLGGCIKFVTADNPAMPVMNPQRGWDVVYQGEVNSGLDLARGNCFWFGGDYNENGWVEQNAKAAEIVALVKDMLPEREAPIATAEAVPAAEPVLAEEPAKPRDKEKLSFFDKMRAGRKNRR